MFCRYLIEIAKIYNIPYEPDPEVMKEDLRPIGKTEKKTQIFVLDENSMTIVYLLLFQTAH